MKVELTGNITIQNLLQVYQQGCESMRTAFAENNPVTFDFSQVQRVDSSSLALLIEWLRYAQNKGGSCEFIALPNKMQRIMGLAGL